MVELVSIGLGKLYCKENWSKNHANMSFHGYFKCDKGRQYKTIGINTS